MDGARRSEGRRVQQFFVELNPVLEAARKLERELDRHLAHRFNVFDYMGNGRPGEVLLSRIIGDLLNPAARHGQGTSLLGLLLEQLSAQSGAHAARPDFSQPVRVQLERLISGGRFIDITVDVETGAGPWCLAIENKPFAGDQPNQVRDYLRYLEDKYKDRFLLIYLSPRGEGPTDYSLPKEELPLLAGAAPRHALLAGSRERRSGRGVRRGERGWPRRRGRDRRTRSGSRRRGERCVRR